MVDTSCIFRKCPCTSKGSICCQLFDFFWCPALKQPYAVGCFHSVSFQCYWNNFHTIYITRCFWKHVIDFFWKLLVVRSIDKLVRNSIFFIIVWFVVSIFINRPLCGVSYGLCYCFCDFWCPACKHITCTFRLSIKFWCFSS